MPDAGWQMVNAGCRMTTGNAECRRANGNAECGMTNGQCRMRKYEWQTPM
jgi:hypothetical protein